MKLDILKIEDTPEGGAVLTMEVDREMLHMVFKNFIKRTIMEKVDETIFEDLCAKDHAREMAEEDGSASESDTTEEEDAYEREMVKLRRLTDDEFEHPGQKTDIYVGFNDVASTDSKTFWSENPHSPGDHR
jgi:hypothetical protein